jgi:hypothetical protein
MMDDSHVLSEMRAVCRPFIFVVNDFGEGTAPASRMDRMTVRLQSPALLRNSRQATHDWLQQQADAIQKRQTDEAGRRSAPKL